MEPDRVELTLLPADDDPAAGSAEYQAAIRAADRTLREHGVEASSSMLRQDDAEAPAIHLGQMVVTLGPAVAPALAAVVGAWMQGRFGRKARLKVGDVEAEARTPGEVAQLLKLVPFEEAVERDGLPPPTAKPQDDGLVLGGEDEGDGWTGSSITLSGPSVEKLRNAVAAPPAKPMTPPPRRVFIVHGHDEAAREAVARFFERMQFDVVILHERPNKGRTIITKFREEAAEIGFAVVLMTPDDHGGKAGAGTNPRARQNVVFELGFFIGALGPERVAALVKGTVERPSDFDGVVYIDLDGSGAWRTKLIQELEVVGFEIDWKRALRP